MQPMPHPDPINTLHTHPETMPALPRRLALAAAHRTPPNTGLHPKAHAATALTLGLGLLLGLLGLPACTTVQVDVPAVAVPTPDHFDEAQGTASTELSRWWQDIPDPTLQSLITQALAANADIRVALARVRESRAVVTQAESALYPSLQAFGYTARTQTGSLHGPAIPQVTLPALPAPLPAIQVPDLSPLTHPKVPISSYSGQGFAAAWEVDIFGARRSDAEAARQAVLAQAERVHGAQLMVAGDVAANYIEARSLEHRIGLLQRSLSSARRLQRYAQGRFDAGQATRLDIDRARAQVESLEGAQAPLHSLLQARLRRLAVLTGQPPEARITLPAPTTDAPADASVIPAQLPAVLPSDVLNRRPDVRGSARVVRTLAARAGSAKADLFPRFYVGFLANEGRIDIGNLASNGNLLSWGAGLRLPIFEGGRIRARIAASNAQLDAAVAQHEQTMLTALEDVENAYSARRALDQRTERLSTAWRTSADGAQHAQRLFSEGHGLLPSAIEAELAALQREDELIQAQTARALVTVALYKSVGGGWSDGTPLAAKAAPTPQPRTQP